MEGKNETFKSLDLNTQYFAAASNEFQFPSLEVKTWIINDDVFGPVVRQSPESKAGSWLRRIGPNTSFH